MTIKRVEVRADLEKALVQLKACTFSPLTVKQCIELGFFENNHHAWIERENKTGPKFRHIGPMIAYEKSDVVPWLEAKIAKMPKIEEKNIFTEPKMQMKFTDRTLEQIDYDLSALNSAVATLHMRICEIEDYLSSK